MSSAKLAQPLFQWTSGLFKAWDRFWFTPRRPEVLGLLRIATGAMLLYCHIVLAMQLTSFLGDEAWINNETAKHLHDNAFGIVDAGRSYLWHLNSPTVLWSHQFLTIAVTAAFLIGLLTRLTGPAAWFLQLMYIHRLTGTLFGLDQIATYSVMYLALAPCGSVFSVDAWIRRRWADKIQSNGKLNWLFPDSNPSVLANIATRLLQLHLCVIYLFGGLAKARGDSWWDGTAVWYAIGNYEYQSVDMTWMAGFPRLVAALSNVTLFWEVFYCALIWPRLTRPIVLAMAIAVHGGIALFLGMATFGLMMIAANMIFIDPSWLMGGWRNASLASEDEMEADEDDFELDDFDIETDEQDMHVMDDSLSESGLEIENLGVGSGIHQDMDGRAERIKRAERRVREKHAQLTERHAKMKKRESKYRERVERLKRREAKIKRYAEQRRKTNEEKSQGDA